MSQHYLTVKDVADTIQVSSRTVERWIERGDLLAVRFGPKLLRIRPTDLKEFEAKLCPTTASNDPSSTESNPTSGTSAGRKTDARVVALRDRRTR
jgi:excisionase family DNA binding protein